MVKLVFRNNSHVIDFDQNKSHLEAFFKSSLSDCKICIYSIAGVSRRGKSFLWNYALRFLRSKFARIEYPSTFSSSEVTNNGADDPLLGFPWKIADNSEAPTLTIWLDAFVHQYPDGEKFAILLMDTNGLFDDRSLTMDSARDFAISLILSSHQTVNVDSSFDETDLEYLEKSIKDTLQLLPEAMNHASFPNLLFAIRDYHGCDEEDFGFEAGKKLISDYFAISSRAESANDRRSEIKQRFKNIDCILLPNPGRTVSRKTYDGKYSEIDEDFTSLMEEMFKKLFDPDMIAPTYIINDFLTGSNLIEVIGSILLRSQLPAENTLLALASSSDTTLEGFLRAAKKSSPGLEKSGSFQGGLTSLVKPSVSDIETLRLKGQNEGEMVKLMQELQEERKAVKLLKKENKNLRDQIELLVLNTDNDKLELNILRTKFAKIEEQMKKDSTFAALIRKLFQKAVHINPN